MAAVEWDAEEFEVDEDTDPVFYAALQASAGILPQASAQKQPRRVPNRARREASAVDKRAYAKQFHQAKKDECKSWLENDVYELVDMRTSPVKNYVTGRSV